jgi:hypothetical protein
LALREHRYSFVYGLFWAGAALSATPLFAAFVPLAPTLRTSLPMAPSRLAALFAVPSRAANIFGAVGFTGAPLEAVRGLRLQPEATTITPRWEHSAKRWNCSACRRVAYCSVFEVDSGSPRQHRFCWSQGNARHGVSLGEKRNLRQALSEPVLSPDLPKGDRPTPEPTSAQPQIGHGPGRAFCARRCSRGLAISQGPAAEGSPGFYRSRRSELRTFFAGDVWGKELP